MATFLFAVWPFHSHYSPMLSIADALRQRGHEVAFYTGSAARAAIEGEAFAVFPFENVDERRVDEIMFSRRAYASWRRPGRLKALLREWLLGTVPDQVRDLKSILESWRPDVVVTETSMWAPMLVLHETARLPVAVFSTVVACLIPGPETPLVGLGLPHPRSRLMRRLAGLARASAELLTRDFRRSVNALRRSYDLPPIGVSVTEFAGRMPLYLVPSVPEFDFDRRDLPPSVQYVGPCLWQRADSGAAAAWSPSPSGEPWVHVTEGTMHAEQPVLLQAAVRGLANRGVRVTMDTGGRDPEELALGELAPNLRVDSWVPHQLLFPHLDVMVTTGGAGTVMAALQAGVPLVVVPTEWDKPENARRVVEAGVGLRVAPHRCTPRRLRLAVEAVLGDSSFRDNARRLSRILGGYGGPTRAAELLELLSARQAPATASASA